MGLLRESSELSGGDGRLEAVVLTGDTEAPSGVAGGPLLAALVDAAFSRDGEELARARAAVLDGLGAAALVDAAAVYGNFSRMVRIADGTGIPLDDPMLAITADLRGRLGIDRFSSAANTPRTPLWRRPIGWLGSRAIRQMMRRATAASRS